MTRAGKGGHRSESTTRTRRKAQGTIRHRRHGMLAFASLAVAFATALPAQAPAVELKYDIGAYVLHSDNINLSDNAPQEDTLLEPTMRFSINQTGSDVKIDGRGQVQYTDYLDDTYDDEFRGNFAGSLDWAVLPSRMNLVFQDYLGQQTIDDLDPATPDNLQQVNLFVFGPSFYTRFNPSTRGQFDLRYGNTWAEETKSFDGDRYNGAARVRHEASPTTEFTGTLEATQVKYDDGGDADYDRYDAYVSYKGRRAALDADWDIGYSKLKLDSGFDDDAPLVRGSLTWRMTQRSRLRGDLRYQYTDATQYLITPVVDFGERRFNEILYTDIEVDTNVFQEKTVRVAYDYEGARTTLRLQPYYLDLDYVNDLGDDRSIEGAAFDIAYRITPLVTASMLVTHERNKYDDFDREDKDTLVDVGLGKRFTRHWSGRVGYRYRHRNSNLIDQDYEENVVTLAVAYTR